MLVWLNGAHGVGKTQVAFELAHRANSVWVADPEPLGFGLRRMVPGGRRRDFRELWAWQIAVQAALGEALRGWEGTVLVPQALSDADVLAGMLKALEAAGHEVQHVTLLASEQQIRRRLRRRGERPRDWHAAQARAVARLAEDPRFGASVRTEGRAIGEVAQQVADLVGLNLAADTDTTLERGARRLLIQLRHVHRG